MSISRSAYSIAIGALFVAASPLSSQSAYPPDSTPVHPGIPCEFILPPTNAPWREMSNPSASRIGEAAWTTAANLLEDHGTVVFTAHDHCYTLGDLRALPTRRVLIRVVKVTTDSVQFGYRGDYHSIALSPTVRVPGSFSELWWKDWTDRGKEAIAYARTAAQLANVKIILDLECLKASIEKHQPGIIIGFEGARPLGGSNWKDDFDKFYKLGLRDLQPMHESANYFAEGYRLSKEGQDLVRETAKKHVVLDLSHMTPAMFADAVNSWEKPRPVLLSHTTLDPSIVGEYRTNGKKLAKLLVPSFSIHCDQTTPCGDPRATVLDKNAIARVAALDGVIAVHFSANAVRPDLPSNRFDEVTIGDVVDQLDALRQLVGSKHVALGPDYFAGAGGTVMWARGGGFRDDMALNVTTEMLSRKFKPKEVKDILGWNLIELYGAVWTDQTRTQVRAELKKLRGED